MIRTCRGLHAPERLQRSGEKTDFSHTREFSPDCVTGQGIAVQAQVIRDQAFKLIRALGDNGAAISVWIPYFSAKILKNGLRLIMRIWFCNARIVLVQWQEKSKSNELSVFAITIISLGLHGTIQTTPFLLARSRDHRPT